MSVRSSGRFRGANARLVCNDLGRRRLSLLLLFFGRHVWRCGETEGDMIAIVRQGVGQFGESRIVLLSGIRSN